LARSSRRAVNACSIFFFGGVDQGALRLALFGIELAEALHQFGHLAGLAQVFRFCVFQRGSVLCGTEIGLSRDDEFFQRVHACSFPVWMAGGARNKNRASVVKPLPRPLRIGHSKAARCWSCVRCLIKQPALP
jgi:hypothetical protein